MITRAIWNHCSNKSLPREPFFEAAKRIKEAMPQSLSIDNFLDAHHLNEEINFVGKIAIVQSILEAERASVLYDRENVGNLSSTAYMNTWLIPFAQRLFEGCRAEDVVEVFDNLSFIVFNYDRCLETALFYILRNSYYLLAAEAADIVARARIYHPYGSLGRLPWQTQSGSPLTCSFGEQVNEYQYSVLSQQIKTFTERIEDDGLINKIKTAYANANRLVFIGFAYHDINMQLLASETKVSPQVYGTAFQMSASDRAMSDQAIRQSLKGAVVTDLVLTPDKGKGLLEDYGRSICFG